MAHQSLHHENESDECPRCGWDMRVVGFDTFRGLKLPDPVNVLIVIGARTWPSTWQGTVHFQWCNYTCPNCGKEVMR